MTLGPAIGRKDDSIAIEDLLPRKLYLECVSNAYKIKIDESELTGLGVRPISVAVDELIKSRGFSELDKSRVLGELLKVFDSWNEVTDLPSELKDRAAALFKKVRETFAMKARA